MKAAVGTHNSINNMFLCWPLTALAFGAATTQLVADWGDEGDGRREYRTSWEKGGGEGVKQGDFQPGGEEGKGGREAPLMLHDAVRSSTK